MTGRSFVQRSPTECGVSECNLETSTRGSLGPLGAGEPNTKQQQKNLSLHIPGPS